MWLLLKILLTNRSMFLHPFFVLAEHTPLQVADYTQSEGKDHEKTISYILYSLVPLGILIVVGIELSLGRFARIGAILFCGGMVYLGLSLLFIGSMLFW